MANIDEPIYLACRRALGLDGSSEISGLLSNVQDIDALTDHVINVVRTKLREQNSIRDVIIFVRPFVELFMDSTNAPRMYTINKLLKNMVEFHPALAKPFAEGILQHPRMNFTLPALIWNSAMDLLQYLVRFPDYKGIRDIFKLLLEKVQVLMSHTPLQDIEKVFKFYTLVALIMNPDNNLQLSYFIQNEIKQTLPWGKPESPYPPCFSSLLLKFIDSFRPTAQLVSITGRDMLYPIVGYSNYASILWRLHYAKLKFHQTAPLPFDRAQVQPQTELFCYVIKQLNSRDLAFSLVGIARNVKQRITAIEESLADLLIWNIFETNKIQEFEGQLHLWTVTAHIVLVYVQNVCITLSGILSTINIKIASLSGPLYGIGRDWLMWLIGQMLCHVLNKNHVKATWPDYLILLDLIRILYPDNQSLPEPDYRDFQSVVSIAAASNWYFLTTRVIPAIVASPQSTSLPQYQTPIALYLHVEALKSFEDRKLSSIDDYRFYIAWNLVGHDPKLNSPYADTLFKIYILNSSQSSPSSHMSHNVFGPSEGIPYRSLDAMSAHVKCLIARQYYSEIVSKHLFNQSQWAMVSPGGVESFARLLAYPEVEQDRLKELLSLTETIISKNWFLGAHLLAELFTFRLHRIPTSIRAQLLQQFSGILASPQHAGHPQLYCAIQNLLLNLILQFNCTDLYNQVPKLIDSKMLQSVFTKESEEINKVFILCIARSFIITGSESMPAPWCTDFLTHVMQLTPHGWSASTLDAMPTFMAEWYRAHQINDAYRDIRARVDEDYKKLTNSASLANEQEIVKHFSQPNNTTCFCVFLKLTIEDRQLRSYINTFYEIFKNLLTRSMNAHYRTLAEYILREITLQQNHSQTFMQKYADAVVLMATRYNIIQLDRLLLILFLRPLDEAKTPYVHILFYFMINSSTLSEIIKDFGNIAKSISCDIWSMKNFHEKFHCEYHKKNNERFFMEGLIKDYLQPSMDRCLPTYYSNMCLRLLPIFELIISRMFEHMPNARIVDTVLPIAQTLFRAHAAPVTFLYHTLFVYEKKLREKSTFRQSLIIGTLGNIYQMRKMEWCFSNHFTLYIENYLRLDGDKRPLQSPIFNSRYAIDLLHKLVDDILFYFFAPIYEKNSYQYNIDWRYNEFANPSLQLIHCLAIEIFFYTGQENFNPWKLFAEPFITADVLIPRANYLKYLNAMGLVFSALPEYYWSNLFERMYQIFEHPLLLRCSPTDIMDLLNFRERFCTHTENMVCCFVAVVHSIWLHGSISHLQPFLSLVQTRLSQTIKTENQLLLAFQLIGPFLQRIQTESTKLLLEFVIVPYDLIARVDAHQQSFVNVDTIANFLYHIKYIVVGDAIRDRIETVVNNLHCEKLRSRLHFLCAKTDVSSSIHSQGPASAATPQASSVDSSSNNAPTHGQLKPGTSTIQMQYTTAAMQVPPYGVSPQNIQQHFQLTTGVASSIGSDGNQQQQQR
ncbi:unnamed protein product [Adineta steineri]|uniref:Mediator of RNA polymerase II transcription subunit 23 n=1 Tax=Adineta steineri TaxID=433720 RepID=A0A814ADB5_9BILA|nr:unnamed protein product [Adineta steineri]CAF1353948.1 unnamed protein product [Adineta steineri]